MWVANEKNYYPWLGVCLSASPWNPADGHRRLRCSCPIELQLISSYHTAYYLQLFFTSTGLPLVDTLYKDIYHDYGTVPYHTPPYCLP